MKLNSKDTILIFIILSIFIADVLIYCGILNLFFKDKETIWAGLIALLGAIIGGGITYLGVRRQIQQREKEIFMGTVTETLVKINQLINQLKPIEFTLYYLINPQTTEADKEKVIKSYIFGFIKVLKEQEEIVYKYLDYDLVLLIRNFQRGFPDPQLLEGYNIEMDIYKEVKECTYIFNKLIEEEKRIEQRYKEYKNTP
ncbi:MULTISPECIES: hypothetical protein [Bacillus]|nr:hypothetical protein [Bacillus altitudinis]AKC66894.1 hypothetical protein VT48_12865 [Bacillus altitudinis]